MKIREGFLYPAGLSLLILFPILFASACGHRQLPWWEYYDLVDPDSLCCHRIELFSDHRSSRLFGSAFWASYDVDGQLKEKWFYEHLVVRVVSVSSRDLVCEVVTGEDGRFSCETLKFGRYFLVTCYPGFMCRAGFVEILESEPERELLLHIDQD